MTRTQPRGYTLVELMVVIAILGILAAMTFSLMTKGPRKGRVSGGAMEIAAEMTSARSAAYGRGMRAALLINTEADGGGGKKVVRYWTVIDPWFTLDDAMAANDAWVSPADLDPPSPPAETSDVFRVLSSTSMPQTVTGQKPTGTVTSPFKSTLCSDWSTKLGFAAGANAADFGAFPPPYCAVPYDGGCTFCSSGRGAVVFEPDGRTRLLNHKGEESAAGAGSIALDDIDRGKETKRAVVITTSGLVRSF